MTERQELINNLIDIWQEKNVTRCLPSEGKSMYPLIKQGDNILINFVPFKNIKVGDIAAFRRNNLTIVHRLIKKMPAGFVEKGDFQIKGFFVKNNAVLGKVPLQPRVVARFLSFFGYLLYKLGPMAKPLLVIPFMVNAGTRIYLKLRQD